MSLIVPLITAALALGTFLLVVVSAAFNALVNAVTWTALFLVSIAAAVLSFAQKRDISIVLVIGLTLVGVVTIAAKYDVNYVTVPLNIVAEGPGRFILEVASKAVFVNIKAAYEALAPILNDFYSYFVDAVDVWWADLKDLYNIIAATGDYLRGLAFTQVTFDFLARLLYAPTAKPVGGKVEFFNDAGDTFFYEFPQAPLLLNGDPTQRYPTNPAFGAFAPVDLSGPLFYLQTLVVDLLEIIKHAGDLVFGAVADFAFPAQLLSTSFIIDTNQPDSIWRKAADLATRVISLFAGSSFYPKSGTLFGAESVQPARYHFELYLANVMRILAYVLRLLSLLINDVTTYRRPLPLSTPIPSGLEYVTNKLIGFPVVDIILGVASGDYTAATQTTNLFSANFQACRALQLEATTLSGTSSLAQLTAAALGCAGTPGQVFFRTYGPRDGIFADCHKWDGIAAPAPTDSVDYWFEFYRVVPLLAQFIQDPTNTDTSAATTAQAIYDNVIEPILQILYDIILLFVGALFKATCNPNGEIDGFVSEDIQSQIDAYILPYYFAPDNCFNAGASDPFTCFVALESRHSAQGFWHFLCETVGVAEATVDGFSSLGGKLRQTVTNAILNQDYSGFATLFDGFKNKLHCDLRRKRNVASETFASDAAKKAAATMTLRHRLNVFAMGAASHTRAALGVFQQCALNDTFSNTTGTHPCAASPTSCSMAPCVEAVLDCLVYRLPPDNMWHQALSTREDTGNAWPRNLIALGMQFSDLARGCSDSFIVRTYRSLLSSVDTTRRFFAKWVLLYSDYVPAYFACMERLRNAQNHTTSDHDALEFAYCIGLLKQPPQHSNATWAPFNGTQTAATRPPPPPTSSAVVESVSSEPNTWSAILEAHGVHANSSWCAANLHRRGVVVEDDVSTFDRALSLDHLAYRWCAFQLTFATRATLAHRTTSRRLGDFLDGWQAPLALLDSLDSFDERHIAALPVPVHAPLDALPLKLLDSDAPPTEPRVEVTEFIAALQSALPYADYAAAAFHYYADLYEQVATKPSTPEEKVELDQRLLLHHVGLREASLQKRSVFRARRQFDAVTEPTAQSEMLTTLDARKRAIGNALAGVDSRITAMQVFGRSLYFAGNYPVATAMDAQEDAPFEVRIDNHMSLYEGTPRFEMRTLHTDPTTGAPLTDAQSQTLWHMVSADDFGAMLVAINSEFGDNAQVKQLVVQASSAYENMRQSLVQRRTYPLNGQLIASNVAAVKYASTMVSLVWRILNRRLRVEGLQAFQTASLIVSMLGMRQPALAQVPAWLRGDVSYLANEGFVDNDVYARYMEHQNAERKRAIFLYGASSSASASGEAERADYSFYTVRRSTLLRARAELDLKQQMSLAGVTEPSASAFYERQRASVLARVLKKRNTFARRAAFIVRHNMHAVDGAALHLTAPAWWRKRNGISVHGSHSNTTVAAHMRFSLVADVEALDVEAVIDDFLQLFGVAPGWLQTQLASLEAHVLAWFTVTSTDQFFFTNLRLSYLNYVHSQACVRAVNVATSGTGPYLLGCLPYLWERLFAFYQYFPLDRAARNYGVLGYFLDAGYIRWPTEMIAVDCPVQRNPIAQCPQNPPLPIWLQQVSTETFPATEVQSTSGESVTVYPIDTTGWLASTNVCLTDYCLVSTVARPLCPVFDYCTRTLRQPAEFGFTSVGANLALWINDLRANYQVVLSDDPATLGERFYGITLVFALILFASLMPFGSVFAYTLAVAVLITKTFVTVEPQLFVYAVVYLWVWLVALPLGAVLQWALLVVALFQMHFLGINGLQQFLLTNLPKVLPDTLLVSSLNLLSRATWLNQFFALFSVLGGTRTFNVAAFGAWATSIQAFEAAFPPTEINNIMALFSLYNVLIFVLEVVGVLFGAAFVGGLLFNVGAALLPIFTGLATLASALGAFLLALVLVGLGVSVGELEDDVHSLRQQMYQILLHQHQQRLDNMKRLRNLSIKPQPASKSTSGNPT